MSHEVTKSHTDTWRPPATREHLISTKATAGTCHRCAAPILSAHDDGLLVRVDTTPLPDKAAEIAALLDARDTYTHTIGGLLIQRTADSIPSGWPKGTIHSEHRCPPAANIQEGLF